MRLSTLDQLRKIEELSEKEYGVSGEILMEAAGALAAAEVASSLSALKTSSVGIVCGPGNNGGDGLVVASHLHSRGVHSLSVLVFGQRQNFSPLFQKQLQRVLVQGIKVVFVEENPKIVEEISSCSVIVDALFGIGLSQEITGHYARAIDLINSFQKTFRQTVQPIVVSLDTPTGLDAQRGNVLGRAVKATQTLTFGLAKPGFFVNDGPDCVGELKVLPIGFAHKAVEDVANTHFLFDEKAAKKTFEGSPRHNQ